MKTNGFFSQTILLATTFKVYAIPTAKPSDFEIQSGHASRFTHNIDDSVAPVKTEYPNLDFDGGVKLTAVNAYDFSKQQEYKAHENPWQTSVSIPVGPFSPE
jgi:hypothetical protein